MTTIVLGQRPKHITRTVEAPMPDGSTASVQVQYVYRTRTEFGELIDQRMAEARATAEAQSQAEPPQHFSVADQQRASRDANAAYLMDILAGWAIDTPLTLGAAQQLCDELPGVAQALIDSYRAAVVEGRLGN